MARLQRVLPLAATVSTMSAVSRTARPRGGVEVVAAGAEESGAGLMKAWLRAWMSLEEQMCCCASDFHLVWLLAGSWWWRWSCLDWVFFFFFLLEGSRARSEVATGFEIRVDAMDFDYPFGLRIRNQTEELELEWYLKGDLCFLLIQQRREKETERMWLGVGGRGSGGGELGGGKDGESRERDGDREGVRDY